MPNCHVAPIKKYKYLTKIVCVSPKNLAQLHPLCFLEWQPCHFLCGSLIWNLIVIVLYLSNIWINIKFIWRVRVSFFDHILLNNYLPFPAMMSLLVYFIFNYNYMVYVIPSYEKLSWSKYNKKCILSSFSGKSQNPFFNSRWNGKYLKFLYDDVV